MGTRRKRMRMLQDEIEHTERRRSSRIIALEQKKQEERESKLALALASRKNNSANHDNRNKEKGKATIDVGDHLDDSNEDEQHGPTKKGRKSKAIQQLISSTKEGRHPQNESTSRTNVSSVNSMPEKHVLEFVLDALQRKDPDELFAEPVNPDVVKDYYRIVKQPMDFGTMRAKLHEGMYTNLEQFKRDVFLICSNAMNANPATSRYHKVAEAINGHARRVFEGLSADPEHFDSAFSLNKRRPNRNPQDEQPRTSRHARVPPKPVGRNNNATHSTVPETEKRDMYWPPSNKTLLSEYLNASKPNIQLDKDASNYKDSLLQFIEDLGPTVQRVAAKKLEAINLFENVSGTQIIPQPTPQAPTQPDAPHNADRLSLPLSLFNRPLTIPGTSAQENRNINTIACGVNINAGAYQGNKICVDNGWDACAAAILGNVFLNSDKGESQRGFESCSVRGTMDIWGPSKDKMVAPHENVISLLGPVQEGTSHNHELRLGANPNGKTGQWNSSAGIPDMLVTESSSRVLTHVWPTQVIQPKPLESIGNSVSGLSFMPQPRAEDSMPNINLLEQSLLSHQPRPANSMSLINDSGLSLVSQPGPEHSMFDMPSINLSGLSLESQPRPADSMSGINLSNVSLLPQLKLGVSIPSNNLPVPSILPSQAAQFSNWNEPDTSLFGLGTPYQPGDFQALMGSSSTDFSNNPYPVQASHVQVLHQPAPFTPPTSFDLQMQLNSQLNPLGPFPQQEANSSSALDRPLGCAVNYYGGGAGLIGQPDEATPQLLWDNYQQPNLALQL